MAPHLFRPVAVLALCLLPALPALAQKDIVATPYYPLAVGSSWTYRATVDEVTVRVTKHEKVGDVTCARLEAEGLGKKDVEWITTLKDGIYRYKAGADELTPPLCLLPLPLKEDATWEWQSEAGGTTISGTFKLGKEEIQVPAGKFQAVVARGAEVMLGDRRVSITLWFAPDVGVVKQRVAFGEVALELELEKYKAGE